MSQLQLVDTAMLSGEDATETSDDMLTDFLNIVMDMPPKTMLSKAEIQIFRQRCRYIGDSLFRSVMRAILSDTSRQFRPLVSDVMRTAAELVSPCPTPEEAFLEMSGCKETHGHNKFRDPASPWSWVTLEPAWSHVLITRTVKLCGGWSYILDGELRYQEGGEQGRFCKVYAKELESWRDAVSVELNKPVDARNISYFPRYKQYVKSSFDASFVRHQNLQRLHKQQDEMPVHIQQMAQPSCPSPRSMAKEVNALIKKRLEEEAKSGWVSGKDNISVDREEVRRKRLLFDQVKASMHD